MLPSLLPHLLLADIHLRLPGGAADCRHCASLPDPEGQATGPEGLQVHSLYRVYIQHSAGYIGSGDLWTQDIYQYRDGDICGWDIYSYHDNAGSAIRPKGNCVYKYLVT